MAIMFKQPVRRGPSLNDSSRNSSAPNRYPPEYPLPGFIARFGEKHVGALQSRQLSHHEPHAILRPAFGEPQGVDAARRLEADSCYETARKSFGQAGKEALEQARRDFQRAVEILPEYALAHSGVGAAHALCSLNRQAPDHLDSAQLHLTRALELDAELAEHYPGLCYVFMRRNQLELAVQAGLRRVQLQPNLAHAHYFLGLAYFAAAELNAGNYQNSAMHLLGAARIGPNWQPTWFVLSYSVLLTGDYPHAEEYAGRLLVLLGLRPPGRRTMPDFCPGFDALLFETRFPGSISSCMLATSRERLRALTSLRYT
jgi:hypothetical protein